MDITNLNRGQLTLMGSAFCTMLAMLFTLQLLSQHVFYWKNPKQQKAIIIIILMAPIYAIDSFVGLLDVKGSEAFFMFLDSVKECYEALVIAKFLALMYSYLNISISRNIVPDEIKGREIHHSFPMTLFQPHTVRLDHRTLRLLKYWTWQFVIVRPICSVLMITLQILGIYPSWLSWTFTIILNISVSLALYSLVVFYHVFAKELKPHNPLAKFLCIKGIVFFCFWQVNIYPVLLLVLLLLLLRVGRFVSQSYVRNLEGLQGTKKSLQQNSGRKANHLTLHNQFSGSGLKLPFTSVV
ncbi:transmembrane protein 184 homolog DDB_G0279555 isoform X1 [Manihot esculenta]|uniref:transmembrane protein 184 homolog DDB_G0279555 isoform X1 n=1 Tax=Manihot esculenta TaxID=3983 RepID=UPI001CC43F1B|nr:transmembrane protein 184 homolog DDB_G0279555 isoform X1 [Manihot esculenta]XP_043807804.1 transmembrane protein 184 homolog DDB_G0279555 isoform X1 [Manihot esculenta]